MASSNSYPIFFYLCSLYSEIDEYADSFLTTTHQASLPFSRSSAQLPGVNLIVPVDHVVNIMNVFPTRLCGRRGDEQHGVRESLGRNDARRCVGCGERGSMLSTNHVTPKFFAKHLSSRRGEDFAPSSYIRGGVLLFRFGRRCAMGRLSAAAAFFAAARVECSAGGGLASSIGAAAEAVGTRDTCVVSAELVGEVEGHRVGEQRVD